jgi:hypothetical protein
MRKLVVVAAVAAWISPVGSVLGAEIASPAPDFLSFDQQIKVAKIITHRTPPLTKVNFPIAVASLIPSEIPIEPIPAEAQSVAPALHGFGYIVVEEMIAIADQQSRKIVIVFPRWG